jgi:hypothetical protein
MTTLIEGARVLAYHGGVVEVRLLNTPRRTVSGYFDDLEALVAAVAPWDGRASIYLTANPVQPVLLARARNRLKEFVTTTTADDAILRRAWFLLDVDPALPKGIASTDEEMLAALERRNEIVAFLRDLDFPDGLTAMSGNGGHAAWHVDLPNDDATKELFSSALKALASRFTDAVARVDEGIYNAARIWKLYGAVAVKGDPSPDRPHRRACLDALPSAMAPLPRDLIARVAALGALTRPTVSAPPRHGRLAPLDLVAAFQARGWYKRPLGDGRHAVVCPWVTEHSGDSGVTESVLFEPKAPGESWGYKCMHSHCTGRTIRDVLRVLDLGPAPGEAAPDRDDASDEAPSDPDAPSAAPILVRASLAEILALDPATLQTKYIVAPYLPENGLAALSSKPGVGKTKLALDLCLARATGGRWLGLPVVPGPALFWSGEQGRKEDYRNVQALCRGRGVTTAPAYFFDVISDPALRFGHPTMLAVILKLVAEHAELLIGIDSIRRAFAGEDIASDVADEFFRAVLVPLRAAGATVLLLAHPPKTSGTQKTIPDENMIRGSGDFAGQLDGFMVLRPITRKRRDADTEDVVTRLTHPKGRRGWLADPLLVTLHVTQDRAPDVAFRFDGAAAAVDAGQAAAAATRALALLAEDQQRLGRQAALDALGSDHGRPAIEAALQTLVGLGVLRGPLDKAERRTGERGHVYAFVRPLPPDPPAPDGPPPDEDDDDLPF